MQRIEVADEFPVPKPYVQKFEAAKFGTYVIKYYKERGMTFAQFCDAAQNNGNSSENQFWNNIKKPSHEQISPIYGNDNQMSLFADGDDVWNLSKITKNESLIHAIEIDMPGVLQPYLYNGSGFTCFAMRAEDSYVGSINVLHQGESKF